MTEQTHTPGPLQARGRMPGSYGLPTITDEQGGHVAYVVRAEYAPVFAAAPEMLATLKDARGALLNGAADVALDWIASAIAKATTTTE